MGIGGISSSLINIANALSTKYEVSILYFLKEGKLKDKLSSNVRLIEPHWMLTTLCLSLTEAKKRGFKYFLFKVFSVIWSKLFSNRFPIFVAVSFQNHLGNYDLACSYTHEVDKHKTWSGYIRLLIRKTNAVKKMAWIHCDYTNLPQDKFNCHYYNKIDCIVGVSLSVATAFKNKNPHIKTPVDYCYNIVDKDSILAESREKIDLFLPVDSFVCFSACRLCDVKGIERTILSIGDILRKYNIYWLIAGNGPNHNSILKFIHENSLENNVILLGDQKNPYKFMAKSDIYLSTSYEEAAPMVFLEAKILGIPVMATDTLSAKEMLDNDNDYICENNSEGIRKCFLAVLENKDKIKQEKKVEYSIMESMSKFDRWINNE